MNTAPSIDRDTTAPLHKTAIGTSWLSCSSFLRYVFTLGLAAALSQSIAGQGGARYFLDLDGVNDYLSVADSDHLSLGNSTADTPLTFELWFRPDSMSVKQILINKGFEGANPEYRLHIVSNAIRFDLYDRSTQATVSVYTGNQASLVGTWHHLAATYDGRGGSTAANGITIYVDGVPLTLTRGNSAAYVAMENGTATVQIGRESAGFKQFDGALDEIRFWNVLRTQGEIQANSATELVGAQPGLVAYWKLNDGTGTSAADDSGQGLTATLFNSPMWLSGGMVGPSDPDITPPEISDIATANSTDTSVTISFDTNETTTGWVSVTPNGSCPCTDTYSPASGTTHVIQLTGLAASTLYTFEAKATDQAGNPQTGPSMTFTTLAPAPDTTPPTVSITRPLSGSVSGSVLVEATATDTVGVVGVQFTVDGEYLGLEDLTSPYSFSWDTTAVPDGAHTIIAEARDAADNIGTTSVTINVSNTAPPITPYYIELDGTDDYISVPDTDSLSFGNSTADTPLTFELWFRPDSMAVRQSLINKGFEGANPEYRLHIVSNAIRFDLYDRSTQATVSAYTGNQASLVGTWHHLAATYDGRGGSTAANGITIYVDGVPLTLTRGNSAAYVAMENGTATVQIGRESAGFKQFDGALDEIRFWNVLRTQGEIQANSATELVGAQPGLVAYWKLNEGTGTTAADDSGHGLTATLFNSPTWLSGGPIPSNVQQSPAITSAGSATFPVGATTSFTIAATGFPVPTLDVLGALPTGVTLTINGNGTATLAGMPVSGATGAYPLSVSATNGVGAPASQAFTLTVTQGTAITSAAAAAFPIAQAGSFTLTAIGFPAPTLAVSGALPAGVTFTDNGNGTAILAGTPASGSAGVYPLTVTATNGAGTPATQSFSLTVTQPVAITSANSTSFAVGTSGSFIVTSTGFPLPTFAATGALPAGVTFTDNGNGTATLAGTPAPGTGRGYPLSVSATNAGGAPATQILTVTVTQPAVVSSATSIAFAVNAPGSFSITATGFPVPILETSGALPGGVTFVANGNGTATLAGTPDANAGGTYPLTFTATNGVGSPASQSFTLTVLACTIATPAGSLQTGTYGSPYAFAFAANGGTGHTFALTSGSLPTGVVLSSGGALSGTPTNTGVFTFTVTATNSTGCVASSAFSTTISPDAHDETFSNGVGNTQYSVGAGAPSTPAVIASGTVLSNDLGPGTLAAGPASIATSHGGQVAMSAAGTFLYTPPTGFAGPSDTFTYTLTDGNGIADTAVVTINLGGAVWYVNAAAGSGDGRSHSPFNSMTAASTAAQPGHYLYVHPGSPSGSTAMKTSQTLWGAGANFTVNGLFIPAATAPTLQGTVTLADNVALNALSVTGGAGAGIVANGLTGIETLDAVSIVGGTTGLQLTNLGGTLTMTGGAILGVSGADVLVSGGTGVLSIGATITNTAGRSVDIQNRTLGAVTFSGSISDIGSGIFLNSNIGSTFSFTGGLALATGANPGFTAVNSGSVTATQNNTTIVNTIVTTTATALNVSHTEIGTAGITFRSISAGSGSLTPGVGIILDTTGTAPENGGLTVTGNGTLQSGGTIRRKSGPDGSLTSGIGIYLNNTKDAAFNWMDLNRFDNSAIVGRNVNGFLLANTSVGAAGTTVGINEGPLVFGLPVGVNGLQGTGLIRDSLISGGVEDNVAFFSHSGSMTLQIDRTVGAGTDCQIASNSMITGGRGLLIQIDGTATASATIDKCKFRNNRTAGVVATASGDSAMTLLVTGSPTDGSLKSQFSRSSSQGQGRDGIVVSNAGNADVTATIENTLISNLENTAIWVGQAPGNATSLSSLRATIRNNQIGSASSVSSSAGIVARLSSSIGEVSETRLFIANNMTPIESGINMYSLQPGISIDTPDPGTTPAVDVTVKDNHIDMRETAPGSGIRGPIGVHVRPTRGNLCASVVNNISHWYPAGLNPQGGGIRLEQADSAIFRLEQGSQPLGTPAATVLQANNPAPGMLMVTEVFGSVAVVDSGACLLP